MYCRHTLPSMKHCLSLWGDWSSWSIPAAEWRSFQQHRRGSGCKTQRA